MNANADIVALENHIRALRGQLTTSHNDLIRLRSFLNQPPLHDPTGRKCFTKYIIARQDIAIEYASKTLKSISDVVNITGAHISSADSRLEFL